MLFHPFPDDFAPYEKDLAKPTTGVDAVYRIICGPEGKPARVEQLTPEECEARFQAMKKKNVVVTAEYDSTEAA